MKQRASQKARKYGLDSLNEMAELTGHSRQTLHNFYMGNRIKFDVLLYGAVEKKKYLRMKEDEA